MHDSDLNHLRTALQVAWRAREHGNHPFGALLVDENNQVLMRAENNLMRRASQLCSSRGQHA